MREPNGTTRAGLAAMLALVTAVASCHEDLGIDDRTFGCSQNNPCGSGYVCGYGDVCVKAGTVQDVPANDGCTPVCDNRNCGDDGCGGTCGECPQGQTCDNGTCAPTGPCGGVTDVGCCEDRIVVWCEDGALQSLNCEVKYGQGTACGWVEAQGFYYCQGQGEDPSGAHPLACQY